MRWPIHAFIAATIFAVLYRYWLTTPVLQYVTIGRWRLFAIVVATVCGSTLSLLRVSRSALSCGAMAGLLSGGTWATWKSPNDVTISVYAAFASHLESFWRETLGKPRLFDDSPSLSLLVFAKLYRHALDTLISSLTVGGNNGDRSFNKVKLVIKQLG